MKQEHLMNYIQVERNEADERVRVLQQRHDREFQKLYEKYLAVQVVAFVSILTIIALCAIPNGLFSKIFTAVMRAIYE